MPHWCVKLEDDNGQFWHTSHGERTWSDSYDDATRFNNEDDATKAADRCKGEVKQYTDWFPKVRVIKFKS